MSNMAALMSDFTTYDGEITSQVRFDYQDEHIFSVAETIRFNGSATLRPGNYKVTCDGQDMGKFSRDVLVADSKHLSDYITWIEHSNLPAVIEIDEVDADDLKTYLHFCKHLANFPNDVESIINCRCAGQKSIRQLPFFHRLPVLVRLCELARSLGSTTIGERLLHTLKQWLVDWPFHKPTENPCVFPRNVCERSQSSDHSMEHWFVEFAEAYNVADNSHHLGPRVAEDIAGCFSRAVSTAEWSLHCHVLFGAQYQDFVEEVLERLNWSQRAFY
ncbi:hypothetical protein Cob_v004786 [Colletotrichum orbiculare MAFF 240422]|uniref:Uncharacterized protein n=1 Tax=Colletotrichum orbiculare (strain 104-T / ATCC 96160 / CBS 514.97 / LARS 414 / MAFF 240422) TaxID=1213857 RepID=A0A484FX10_COLOR|nr:hypothetical protein Cob_v004786 [Colletotrichum orbiculare MAFF 240422]